MNTQFEQAPLICPNCGHVIGTQAYFQSFEVKVATWLNAEVAPPATRGFDVWHMAGYPDLSFQVKFSRVYKHHPPYKKYPMVTWTFNQKRLDPRHPDFFVFFGLDEDETEHCFLLSRSEFIDYANISKEGTHYLRVSAKKASDRQNYNYVPKIWRYEVPNPATELRAKVIEHINRT